MMCYYLNVKSQAQNAKPGPRLDFIITICKLRIIWNLILEYVNISVHLVKHIETLWAG